MKKFLVVFVALAAAVAVAAPAFAKVEFSYGGQFRVRWFGQSNFATPISQTAGAAAALDGVTGGLDDDLTRLDQRLRLYFTFTASENLRLVTRFEVGDTVWGSPGTTGRVGADGKDIEVKNMYIDFNIPNGMFPLNAKIGTQGLVMLDSWVVDDDFSAAVLTAKFADTRVGLGYIGAQNADLFETEDDIDSYFLHVDYNCAPWTFAFVAFAQAGHDTAVSADPGTLQTPVPGTINTRIPATGIFADGLPRNFFQRALQDAYGHLNGGFAPMGDAAFVTAGQNNLIDLGFQVKYKDDLWSAYLTFVKNLGSVDFRRFDPDGGGKNNTVTADYTGWMVDAGGAYYMGPWTFNLGGFYTTGPEDIKEQFSTPLQGSRTKMDVDWFTYPLATSKYFSEIIGGGIFDNVAPMHEDMQWRGYGFPTNLWTINLGASWQVLPGTKLSFGYWYFSTSEDVVSGFKSNGPAALGDSTESQRVRAYFDPEFLGRSLTAADLEFDTSIGHEFNFYISQKIVDGLMLDLVAAYLIADDAYSIIDDDNDALELGARLQWSF
ncbi:MAG: hypothetical protein MUC41_12505 [Syntrophobacteraceae bacterium]|jgi:hypothetical protein|nr:hypothetical protein [Syntrophobacteraceae bacterium]